MSQLRPGTGHDGAVQLLKKRPRLAAEPRRSPLELVVRSLLRRPLFARRWTAVPDNLGRTKERATAFCASLHFFTLGSESLSSHS